MKLHFCDAFIFFITLLLYAFRRYVYLSVFQLNRYLETLHKNEDFQFSAYLVSLTEQILNGKLNFCAVNAYSWNCLPKFSRPTLNHNLLTVTVDHSAPVDLSTPHTYLNKSLLKYLMYNLLVNTRN